MYTFKKVSDGYQVFFNGKLIDFCKTLARVKLYMVK